MQESECIVRVDIPTGRVLEDNLRAFWAAQARRAYLPDPVLSSNPAMQSREEPHAGEELLAERVKKFNSTRRRRTKNAWTDTELYRLAVLTGIRKQKPGQAATRLARSPRACQRMYKEMEKAGVV